MRWLCVFLNYLGDRKEHYAKRLRAFYYSRLFASCGSKLAVGKDTIITLPDKIHAGEEMRIKDKVIIRAAGGVFFGDNVTISSYSSILTTSLKIEGNTITSHHLRDEIKIGSNVWICANATILGGVSIGDNVIIAAGAVVNKDCASNGLYAGVPARKVKDLFIEKTK